MAISSRSAAFLFLIFFFNTASTYSSIICPDFISSWPLIIFFVYIGLWVILGGVYLADSLNVFFFHLKSHPSWLAAHVLSALFFLLISFNVSHSIFDFRSSTEFLILSIWPWIHGNCSFCLVLNSYFWAFLTFFAHQYLLGFFYFVRILFKIILFFPVS